ncbi:SPT16 protein, partial [Atlantisia rogersi]|nr:SPT16 protein [Atlantisia rogersi]
MASKSNGDFQKNLISMDGKKETCKRKRTIKESDRAANRLNDIPEELHVVENGVAIKKLRRIRIPVKMKKKQRKHVDRAKCKHKLETNEKLPVKGETTLDTANLLIPTEGETTLDTADLLIPTEEETTLDTDDPLILMPPSHIPLKNLMDIEMELVYNDEEDISFEFAEPMVSTSTQPSWGDCGEADALSTSNGSALPQLNRQLQMTLQEARSCYRERNYAAATELFSAALELCSKGPAIDIPFESSPEDISSIASFIETNLATCYLKLKKPNDALSHSHRSIILNPAYFRNHLRQAAAFRCLERYSEAARSAMIADYMYWLTGGTEQHISKLIKLYWQTMIEETMAKEESFSVMYTPFVAEVKANKINKINDIFAKRHPDYMEHIYTDPHGHHILPQTAAWPSLPPQHYLLTLGFRNKYIGKTLERWSRRKLPIFSDRKEPFSSPTNEETEKYWEYTGKKIVPVMDFIRSTKLTDNLCACSRGIEKLHYASLLGRLQRGEEESQVINQAMAELATVPYLQDISQKDAKLVRFLF